MSRARRPTRFRFCIVMYVYLRGEARLRTLRYVMCSPASWRYYWSVIDSGSLEDETMIEDWGIQGKLSSLLNTGVPGTRQTLMNYCTVTSYKLRIASRPLSKVRTRFSALVQNCSVREILCMMVYLYGSGVVYKVLYTRYMLEVRRAWYVCWSSRALLLQYKRARRYQKLMMGKHKTVVASWWYPPGLEDNPSTRSSFPRRRLWWKIAKYYHLILNLSFEFSTWNQTTSINNVEHVRCQQKKNRYVRKCGIAIPGN